VIAGGLHVCERILKLNSEKVESAHFGGPMMQDTPSCSIDADLVNMDCNSEQCGTACIDVPINI
jgi:hypothetical protein